MGFVTKGDVSLNINGVEFEIDSTDLELIDKLDKFSKEGPAKMDKMKDRTDIVQAVRETTQYAVDVIDSFLGEGASAKIWENQSVSIVKATSVIHYINDEIVKARQDMVTKFSPNRTQRRAK